MSVTVYLRKEKFVFEETGLSVDELLKKMDLSPQAYLVIRNKKLMTGREMLQDGDELRVIAVISGGAGA
ncbi:MAG: MoaD/ThiS family protein [Anaerolineaceae bacterium]